jgi:8-oxo-dGTP diphosphatase
VVVCSHYVATGYVYDRLADRFLLVRQKKLGKWLPPGGHLNEGEQPHEGVLREVWEEIGVQGRIVDLLATPDVATPATAQLPAPFCILYETIPPTARDEEHMHIDFVYVLEIDPSHLLQLCMDEVARAEWFVAGDIDQVETFENVKKVCRVISSIGKKGE